MNVFADTWHWSISGFLFGLIMISLNYFGGYFGLSGSYRTICSIGGAGKLSSFFDFDWKKEKWHLTFIAGIVLGGFIAHNTHAVEATEVHAYTPSNLFNSDSIIALTVIFFGALLSGFGARYAGGCTSGHFVSGISNLQFPSFLTLAFFIIGGVLTSLFIMPFLNIL